MRTFKSLIPMALLLGGLAWQAGALADEDVTKPAAAEATPAAAKPAPPTGLGTEYTEQGADTCLGCHDEEADTPTFTTAGIFKSRHGQRGDARSPFGAGGLQCEACHGPGARHAAKGGDRTLTINSFKSTSFLPVAQRNEFCLNCHQDQARTGWHAGAHERSGTACTDCHRLHVERDAVLVKNGESDVCLHCHKKQRAEFQKASSHPVRFGLMGCNDCHNPHGANGAAMLNKPTLNQTCFNCHAEKRGPLLWEHAPVAEDCSLCHTAHGSVREALLNKSPPLLCQQCHSVAGHPAVARTAAGLPGGGGGGSIFVVAGSCTNCHTQVHGSNHPAGAKLMR
jgi:DmsE family decaheme c-type cytochrome